LACCKNGWWKDSKEVTGKQTRRKKGMPRLRWMDDVQLDLRSMVFEQIANKNFGQKRMGICHEASQGQT